MISKRGRTLAAALVLGRLGGIGMTRHRRFVLAAVIALETYASASHAFPGDSAAPAHLLRLKVGDIDTASRENLLTVAAPDFQPDERLILQIDGSMTPARRAALVAVGLSLGEYLPDSAFIVEAAELRLGD